MVQIGITERGDAALNTSWKKWVENGQPAILITKNVKKLIEENKQLLLNGNVIIHTTITGLGGTRWEPNVPNYKKDLDIFGIELDKDPETGMQRPACACLGIKRELLDNNHPCAHGCLYCYWKSN